MKKTINLLPPSVQHERKMKKAKQSVAYIVLACAGSTGGMYQYEKNLSKQITDYESQINSYQAQQSKIEELNKKIESTNEQKKSISSSSFPYHRFLFAITTNAPDDLRVLSVQSVSPNQPDENNNNEQNPAQPGVNTPNTDAQGTAQQNPAQPAATQPGTGQTPTDPNQPVAPVDPNAANLGSPVPGGDNTTVPPGGSNPVIKNEPQEESPFNFGTSEIYIRGYSMYPNSIATLANKLKQETYIADVKVTKIRDYYTGLENFKLFEMKITYQ
ncbi:hypothetical protein [Bacillus thuringiensis]|uniref:hypothetical protein n=1 Tax=Bacillus thuringiensis TaxID=1428 RepID=UPI0021D66570|nr:hypothetical protein [Bacillus thuringiensis]MCU7668041.1 hypothetical protein [Bacillus thuringiensis]